MVVEPANVMVTDEPCVMVWVDDELLNMTTFCPAEKMDAGTVTPPVVMEINLPLSVATRT